MNLVLYFECKITAWCIFFLFSCFFGTISIVHFLKLIYVYLNLLHSLFLTADCYITQAVSKYVNTADIQTLDCSLLQF